MKGITDRQKEVLNFISEYTENNSYPPTVRDIGEHFGISLRAVQDHIAALQKKQRGKRLTMRRKIILLEPFIFLRSNFPVNISPRILKNSNIITIISFRTAMNTARSVPRWRSIE